MSTQTVDLKLRLVGDIRRDLQRVYGDIKRDTRQINTMMSNVNRTQKQNTAELRNTHRNTQQINTTQMKLQQNVQKGYRIQQKTSVEVQKTNNLYKQLSSSTQKWGNSVSVSYGKALKEARKTNVELTKTQKLMRSMGGSSGMMQKATAVGTGLAVAGHSFNNKIQPQRSYDENVARLSATATFGTGMSVDEKKLTKKELNQSIMSAVRYGGGTRDNALSATNKLIGSGEYNLQSVKDVLPATQRAAFVSGASTEDAASVTLQMRNFGISNKDIPQAQDVAVAGGQLGGFEYQDMAKYLPNQLSLAKSAGYGGLDGMKKIVAMNQVAMKTAGNSDEAGNNVINLLQKLNSSEFSGSIAKNITAHKGDPTDSKGRLDWATYARQQKSQGVDQVQAFVGVLERELSGNSEYQQLRHNASNAKGNEAKAIHAQMATMMEGTNIGNVIADRQALMAALAVSTNGDETTRIMGGLDKSTGTVDDLHKLFKGDEWATSMQKQQEALNVNYNLYNKVNGVLGTYNTAMTSLMRNHTELATAGTAATTALTALAAASMAGSLMGGIGGKSPALGKVSKASRLAKIGTTISAGTTAVRGAVAGAATGTAGAVAAAGMGGYMGGSLINKHLISNNAELSAKLSDAIGGTIHTALASLGFENSQQILDIHFNNLINQNQQTSTKYDQMINEQTNSTQIQSQIAEQQAQQTAQTNSLVQIQSTIASQQGQMIASLGAIAAKDFNPQINVQSSPTTIVKQITGESKRGRYPGGNLR